MVVENSQTNPSHALQATISKGEKMGTTKITDVVIASGHHLAVKISSSPIINTTVGEKVPFDRTVTNPYILGSCITGVDAVINKYIGVYEVDHNDQIVNYKLITLTEGDIQPAHWKLVWEDSFLDSEIDEKNWNFVDSGGGFGNKELQYYTPRKHNARLDEQILVLEAHKETWKEHPYTSAKLTTKGKQSWTYGRFSIRAKLPEGQGIWPAIWMMPEDMELYSGWPSCGEIDIMEIVGHKPETVHGTLHYGVPHTYTGESYTLPNGQKFSDDFHEFTLDWEPEEFRWYVDGILYAKQTNWFSINDKDGTAVKYPAPFNRDFYLQVNLAVGGKWPGYPDETTTFPQQMLIDSIKVYKKHRGERND
ncbi:family 16 glycosylhydrolase [Bacillus pinisoli]|uniref:family 16 glycosylhydrolase n=1 Tax=Bacillus pinisoli TaxID=2901866 RepID=UPI001FF31F8E|nr:family 16 glycosylhydrolase [Bacillus pinisoli]